MDKNEIIDYIFEASCHSQRRAIKKHFPEIEKEVLKHPGREWSEQLYNWIHDNNEIQKCVVCGGPSKFRDIKNGYYNTCSYKCGRVTVSNSLKKAWSNKSVEEIKARTEKTKRTCKEKYGVDNPSQHSDIKKKKIETTRTHYGVDNPFQAESIKQKLKQTQQELYGGAGFGSQQIKEKSEQTCQERYGVKNYSQSDLFKTNFDNILQERHPEIIKRFRNENGEYMYECSCVHPECNYCKDKKFIISAYSFSLRPHYNAELCTKLLPYQDWRSSMELQIEQFLDSLKIEYIVCNRDILSGQELDIYIPNKKIAIECNGCYWHSDRFKSSQYHVKKFKKCQKQGIQLIQIWEDNWLLHKDIIKSIISAKLGIFEHRIGASKCKIQTVDKKEAQQFLEQNHIQGRCGCQINYGLYYKGELVSLMTFGRRRPGMGGKTATEGQYELLRFCNLRGWQVIHGAERMLKHFIRDYQPKEIISFSSNDISDGSLYKKLGFEQSGKIESSYWYIDHKSMKRYHRFSFTKQEIMKKGLMPDRECWTEKEAMDAAGYYRIYDSGTTRWVLKNTL